MSKLRNKTINEKDLKAFTKEELIYFILRCSWGNLRNPLEVIYEKRMDDNFKKSQQISIDTKKLLDKMDKVQPVERYKLLLEIQELNKKWDKLRMENDRIMNILYDA